MIICGYPCTGKSTLALNDPRFIDLESSFFKIDGQDNTGWEKNYCEMAISLHNQGYIVFMSTHPAVTGYLTNAMENKHDNLMVMFPDLTLKEEWVRRATERYEKSGLNKDKLALKRIDEHWTDDIFALKELQLRKLVIYDAEYDLAKLIISHINNHEN